MRGGEAGGWEERPGEGDKVVGMQLHVYIHRAMCMCVWYRYADLILVGFSKVDYML